MSEETITDRDCFTVDCQRGRRLFHIRGDKTLEDSLKKERTYHPRKERFPQRL